MDNMDHKESSGVKKEQWNDLKIQQQVWELLLENGRIAWQRT